MPCFLQPGCCSFACGSLHICHSESCGCVYDFNVFYLYLCCQKKVQMELFLNDYHKFITNYLLRINMKGISTNKIQILVGLASLFAGGLIYLVSRSPDHTYFIYRCLPILNLHKLLPNMYVPFSNLLPEFIHTFSFILITAGILSCRKKCAITISLSWLIVDCCFELGQKYKDVSLSIIPNWFENYPILENCNNYFLHGSYDILDLVATLMGAILAYIFILTSLKRDTE
jgi:hypothetical protein